MNIEIEPDKKYLCWSPPIDKEVAIEAFYAKFGYAPKEILIYKDHQLVGPVKEETEND